MGVIERKGAHGRVGGARSRKTSLGSGSLARRLAELSLVSAVGVVVEVRLLMGTAPGRHDGKLMDCAKRPTVARMHARRVF